VTDTDEVRSRLVAILDQLARLGEYSYESVLAAGYWQEFDLGAEEACDRLDQVEPGGGASSPKSKSAWREGDGRGTSGG
jgi:hypothetical protein